MVVVVVAVAVMVTINHFKYQTLPQLCTIIIIPPGYLFIFKILFFHPNSLRGRARTHLTPTIGDGLPCRFPREISRCVMRHNHRPWCDDEGENKMRIGNYFPIFLLNDECISAGWSYPASFANAHLFVSTSVHLSLFIFSPPSFTNIHLFPYPPSVSITHLFNPPSLLISIYSSPL